MFFLASIKWTNVFVEADTRKLLVTDGNETKSTALDCSDSIQHRPFKCGNRCALSNRKLWNVQFCALYSVHVQAVWRAADIHSYNVYAAANFKTRNSFMTTFERNQNKLSRWEFSDCHRSFTKAFISDYVTVDWEFGIRCLVIYRYHNFLQNCWDCWGNKTPNINEVDEKTRIARMEWIFTYHIW